MRSADIITQFKKAGMMGWACNEIEHLCYLDRGDTNPEESKIFRSYFKPDCSLASGGGYWDLYDHEPRLIALLLMAEIAKDL